MSENESILAHLISKRTFPLAIAMLVFVSFSILAWVKIPLEVMPRENVPPFLYVNVEASQSMSPDKIEAALTLPVEGALRTISGLTGLTSQTQGHGASFSLTLKPRTSLDLATLQAQEALQELESKQVLDMKGVTISRLNPEAGAVAKISITYSAALKNPLERIQEQLKAALEAIPEISKIEIMGLEPTVYEYMIPISKAQDAGVKTSELAAALNTSPLRETVGHISRAQMNLPVQARMIVDDLATLRTVNLSRGTFASLSGLGEERRVDKASSEISHKNGRHSVFLEVYAKDSANLFSMTSHLEETLKSFHDLDFEVVFNKTNDLKTALNDVLASLYEAIVITFVVVLLFLRRGRQTVLICVTIPITLLATVLVIYVTGGSLNVLTLSGLILGIGMVVDNAVLVTGTVEELRESHGVKRAAAYGASRVFMALLMSTLTNAIIFLPVSFIEGGDSFTDILKAFQLPIVASLVCSLIVAMLLLPLLIIAWPGSSNKKGAKSQAAFGNSAAKNFFRWTRRYRMPIAVFVFLIVGAIAESALNIEQTDIESPRDPFTTINVKFSSEISSDDRRAYFDLIEKRLLEIKTAVGFRFVVSEFNPKFTTGSLSVYPEPVKTENMDEVLARQDLELKKFTFSLPKRAGVSAQVGWDSVVSGATTRVPDVFAVSGPRTLAIQAILGEMKNQISDISGVQSLRLDREEQGESNLVFVASDSILQQYGLTLSKIATEISSSMTAVNVSGLKLNGQAVAAKVALGPGAGEWTLDAVKRLGIATAGGGTVQLEELGTFHKTKVLRSISRKEGVAVGKIFVEFNDNLSDEDLSRARSAVRGVVEFFDYPKGYGPPKSDNLERLQEMAKKSQFIIYLSIVLIYLVLASLFESVLIPLAILFSVPLALLFGISGLLALGLTLDVMARLSLVILVGIAVNNAIILIDIILELKAQGLRRSEAIIEGCSRRLKAVLMTTSIQVIGVLPVALGKSKIMGIPYASLGVCIISGMLFSTILTLVILPMIYEFLDDCEIKFKAFLSSFSSGS